LWFSNTFVGLSLGEILKCRDVNVKIEECGVCWWLGMVDDTRVLMYVVKRLGCVRGKKAVQKIMYFVKEFAVRLSYRFRWWLFGPFSKELYDDIDFLVARDLLNYDDVSYEISLTNKFSNVVPEVEENIDEETKVRIEGLLEKLKEITNFDPFLLELAASIHFIVNYGAGLKRKDKDAVYETLREIKGERFRWELFNRVWESMEKCGLLGTEN